MAKKPEFIDGLFDMSHVPPPDSENFWKLEKDEPRVVMVNKYMEPELTITVREINQATGEVSLQITASPTIGTFRKQ